MRRLTLLPPLLLAALVGCGGSVQNDQALHPERCQGGWVVEITNRTRYRADVFEWKRQLGEIGPGETGTFFVADLGSVSVLSMDRDAIFVSSSCR